MPTNEQPEDQEKPADEKGATPPTSAGDELADKDLFYALGLVWFWWLINPEID